MNTRFPAVAGSFYPESAQELSRNVQRLLNHASAVSQASLGSNPKAIIVPHAAYQYSGAIAASAYNAIKLNAGKITRVVLLGPAHRLAFRGIATPGCDYFQTPLGDIAIDSHAIDQLSDMVCITELAQAHAMEHSLEVQLPFLQQQLMAFKLVPLVVGEASADEVARLLEKLWGAAETLIVISSDLSHFHSYPQAQILDQLTTRAIEAFDYHLCAEQACGCRPINGLLTIAKHYGLTLTTLDVRNSGDTVGNKAQVVGYGAFVLH